MDKFTSDEWKMEWGTEKDQSHEHQTINLHTSKTLQVVKILIKKDRHVN